MYQYETIDEQGQRESGFVNIDNYFQAVLYVRANFGMIVKLQKLEAVPVTKNNYTDKERIYFFKQLGTVLQSGITILDGLKIIGEGSDKKLNHIAKQLAVRLANGLTISQSMGELSAFFTDLCITLVKAGEESGQLVTICRELAEYYAKKNRTENYVQRAAVYPLVVLFFAVGVLLLFLFVVLPNVAAMYAAFHAEQKGLLGMLLNLRGFLLNYWYMILAVLAVLIFAAVKQGRHLKNFCCHLPVIKNFMQDILEIRFCKLLALLLNSGIPIVEAIGTAALAVDANEKYMELQHLKMALAKGNDLATVLTHEDKFFSPMVKSFLIVGGNTGNLPKLLDDAAGMREEILNDKMERAKELLSPIFIMFLTLFIGVIVLSVLQPIFGLFEALPMY